RHGAAAEAGGARPAADPHAARPRLLLRRPGRRRAGGRAMTLTTRLLLFSLATLALVLAGFSAALYVLAGAHLHRQAEDRLDAAVNTLVAAVEIKSHGVEWEPEQRQVAFDTRAFGARVVWLIGEDSGRAVDGSAPP